MFCPACGTAAGTDDRFCQHCGKPLPADTGQPAATPPPSVEGLPQFPPYVEPTVAPYPGGTGTPPPSAALHRWSPTVPPSGPAAAPYVGDRPGQVPAWPGYAPVPGASLAPFGAPLAGWWQRVGSMVLDILAVGVPMLILDAILNAHFGTRHSVVLSGTSVSVRSLRGGGRTALVIADVCVPLLYFAILNGTRSGQTAGNHAPHIAVRDVNTGKAIGFGRGVVRWLIRFVLYVALVLPGVVNDLFPLWDSRHQSIADKVAHSVVIRLD